MTEARYERNVRMIGEAGQQAIRAARVAVFGVGGVGSYAAEALARAGVGTLLFVDGDCVEESNINRQLVADYETLGRPKAEVMRERALRVDPRLDVTALQLFYDAETAPRIDLTQYDYVVDAIDSVASKLLLICSAKSAGCYTVSAMGAGNKLDPARFEAADISKTSVCPLARVIRRELKARGIEHLRVVYSKEEPVVHTRTPGSISFVPSAMGLLIAGEIINEILRRANAPAPDEKEETV